MNVSTPFIQRPVATSLLGLGLVLLGVLALRLLPVAPLPQVDVPTIKVSAALPGADPQAMAALVATPLEQNLGRIAGITEMTSSSVEGATTIRLSFDLGRDIDGAARDVQAAINATRGALPSGMPGNPSYREVTPADQPIMVIGLTSSQLGAAQLYAAAAGPFSQALAQIPGVGQVDLAGGSPPAVRVELDPAALNRHGIGLEAVREAIRANTPSQPLGAVEDAGRHWQIASNAGLAGAAAVARIIVAHDAGGAALRLGEVARVRDASQDRFDAGRVNGQPGLLVLVSRKPDANVVQTVERIHARLPALRAALPRAVDATVVVDRSTTVRASLADAERALGLAVLLVVLVMLAFLRNLRAALIASAAAPMALLGTLAAMYALGYGLDNLSLMALTIAVGFAVDDAVVVVENITRHLEAGVPPQQAARVGAGEIGLTVLSMSMVLVAVFIPLLFMGGYAGLFVREFAVTLAVVIAISLLIALSVVPMLCAWLLRPAAGSTHGRLYGWSERAMAALLGSYERSLDWVLAHARLTLVALLAVVGLNAYLFVAVPKGFFPRQDTGELSGDFDVGDSGSFRLTRQALTQLVDTVRADPAVASVAAFAHRSGGSLFATLQPLTRRDASADEVAARLNARLARLPGASFTVQSVQDIRTGGRRSRATHQYTVEADDVAGLRHWMPRIQRTLAALPQLRGVHLDSSGMGLDTMLDVDRTAAARHGVSVEQVDAALHDAFGQRAVATLYQDDGPQRVVMGVAPEHAQSAAALDDIRVAGAGGALVPLAVLARYRQGAAPLGIEHQGLFVAETLSFDLAPGVSLSQATQAIERAIDRLAPPNSVRGSFEGSARAFREVAASEPMLIGAALLTLFIVLGVLYESYAHPLTILSTLPSAGVGALLALLLFGYEFDVIALVGVFALVGIVMKNAIMLIDFALAEQRASGATPQAAIRRACLLRFRPILMTTLAVMLAAIPLALLRGNGAEMRQPLGIAMGGGLVMSQLLTLYTTPVVYLYLDRLGAWTRRWRWLPRTAGADGSAAA